MLANWLVLDSIVLEGYKAAAISSQHPPLTPYPHILTSLSHPHPSHSLPTHILTPLTPYPHISSPLSLAHSLTSSPLSLSSHPHPSHSLTSSLPHSLTSSPLSLPTRTYPHPSHLLTSSLPHILTPHSSPSTSSHWTLSPCWAATSATG